MALYEFRCAQCPRTFEEILSVSERNKTILCAVCNAPCRRVEFPRSLPSSPRTSRRLNRQAPSNAKLTAAGGNKPEVFISDNVFDTCKVGISVDEGISLRQERNRFNNVRKAVQVIRKKSKTRG